MTAGGVEDGEDEGVPGLFLVLPDTWHSVDTRAGRLEGSVERLSRRLAGRRDDLPQLRAALAEELFQQARTARAAGARRMWILSEAVGEGLVAASLIASSIPSQGSTWTDDAVDAVARQSDLGLVTTVRLPGLGTARRVASARVTGVGGVPAVRADVFVPTPDRGSLLVLTFNALAPVPGIGEVFLELFDAVAGSARWD